MQRLVIDDCSRGGKRLLVWVADLVLNYRPLRRTHCIEVAKRHMVGACCGFCVRTAEA